MVKRERDGAEDADRAVRSVREQHQARRVRDPLPLSDPPGNPWLTVCRVVAYPFAVFGVVVVLAMVFGESSVFYRIGEWIIDP